MMAVIETQYKSQFNSQKTLIYAEYESEFKLTKNTPLLAFMGKLWDVFCENFGEN